MIPEIIRRQYARSLAPFEKFRHACEVRHVASWKVESGRPDYRRMQEYFAGVEQARGTEAADKLRWDVKDALKKARK